MLHVNKIREAFRVLSLYPDCPIRKGGQLSGCSKNSFLRIRSRIKELGLSFEQSCRLPDRELICRFYPNFFNKVSRYRMPDFADVVKEMEKKSKYRKSQEMHYLEYFEIDPETAYSLTQYKFYLKKYLKKLDICRRLTHEKGDVLYIDYAGMKMPYGTRKPKKYGSVFVACFGWSSFLFGNITERQTTKDWLISLEKCLRISEGVPVVIHCDNASTIVKISGRIPELTDNADAFAKHFGCLIDTSRPGTPRDNAPAEAAVKFITQHILVVMQNMEFLCLEDANAFLSKEISKLNHRPMQKTGDTRQQLFEEESRYLKPLNPKPFEILQKVWMHTIRNNCVVDYEGHEYSVPYTLRGEKVEARVTNTHIRVYSGYDLKAEHKLSTVKGGYTCDINHLSPEQQYDERCDKAYFIKWASGIDIAVVDVIEKTFEHTTNFKLRPLIKRCQDYRKIYEDSDKVDFVYACRYMVNSSPKQCCPARLRTILRAKPWLEREEIKTTSVNTHQNVRGASYYTGGHHE